MAPGSKIVWFKSRGTKLTSNDYGADTVLMRFSMMIPQSVVWFYGAIIQDATR